MPQQQYGPPDPSQPEPYGPPGALNPNPPRNGPMYGPPAPPDLNLPPTPAGPMPTSLGPPGSPTEMIHQYLASRGLQPTAANVSAVLSQNARDPGSVIPTLTNQAPPGADTGGAGGAGGAGGGAARLPVPPIPPAGGPPGQAVPMGDVNAPGAGAVPGAQPGMGASLGAAAAAAVPALAYLYNRFANRGELPFKSPAPAAIEGPPNMLRLPAPEQPRLLPGDLGAPKQLTYQPTGKLPEPPGPAQAPPASAAPDVITATGPEKPPPINTKGANVRGGEGPSTADMASSIRAAKNLRRLGRGIRG